jgi:hypothetical protein
MDQDILWDFIMFSPLNEGFLLFLTMFKDLIMLSPLHGWFNYLGFALS